MKKLQKIGLIECGSQENLDRFIQPNNIQGYQFKKILIIDQSSAVGIKAQYPEVEFVYDTMQIRHDTDIDHVIISAPKENHKSMIGDVLRSGKTVQVF